MLHGALDEADEAGSRRTEDEKGREVKREFTSIVDIVRSSPRHARLGRPKCEVCGEGAEADHQFRRSRAIVPRWQSLNSTSKRAEGRSR